MLVNPIDPSPYARPPRLGADTGLSLSKMLLRHMPPKPGPGVIMAAKMLALSITTLETAWNNQGKPQPVINARPADLRVDRGWGAVQARLTAWGIFPDDDPNRQTSAALAARLFPTGLDFLKLPFLAQHAQSERRLQIIETEGLRADLDRLVGEPFMNELVAAHAAYGEALGITQATPATQPTEPLTEPLRTLGEAIVGYAMQVIAYAALAPAHVPLAKHALQPIDAFRAAASRRAAASANDNRANDRANAPDPGDYALPEGAPAPDSPMPPLPDA